MPKFQICESKVIKLFHLAILDYSINSITLYSYGISVAIVLPYIAIPGGAVI